MRRSLPPCCSLPRKKDRRCKIKSPLLNKVGYLMHLCSKITVRLKWLGASAFDLYTMIASRHPHAFFQSDDSSFHLFPSAASLRTHSLDYNIPSLIAGLRSNDIWVNILVEPKFYLTTPFVLNVADTMKISRDMMPASSASNDNNMILLFSRQYYQTEHCVVHVRAMGMSTKDANKVVLPPWTWNTGRDLVDFCPVRTFIKPYGASTCLP